MAFDISAAAGAAAGNVAGGILGMVTAGAQDRRQIKQQQKLTDIQVKAQKDLTDYSNQKQLEMWHNTSYGAQREELEKAGLNPALMYGMGGGGGVTTGAGGATSAGSGTASTGAANQEAQTGMALMIAQTAALTAQAKKTNAEAEKIEGVDTKKTTAETAQIEFQNKVNNLYTVEKAVDALGWANQKLEISASKEMADFNAWEKANFAGKPTDDSDSPLAKAYRANIEKTIQDLKLAKAQTDATKAEATIKNFQAEMTKEGLAPDTPWYVKFLGEVLTRAGINPMKK